MEGYKGQNKQLALINFLKRYKRKFLSEKQEKTIIYIKPSILRTFELNRQKNRVPYKKLTMYLMAI